jgi:hypothetical protein
LDERAKYIINCNWWLVIKIPVSRTCVETEKSVDTPARLYSDSGNVEKSRSSGAEGGGGCELETSALDIISLWPVSTERRLAVAVRLQVHCETSDVCHCGFLLETVSQLAGVNKHRHLAWGKKNRVQFLCNFVFTRAFRFMFRQKPQPGVSLNTQAPSVAAIINNGTAMSI